MDRVYPLTVTTPAGTLAATPISTVFPLEDNKLLHITMVVPDGPAGLLGIRLLRANQQIWPWSNNYFATPNGEIIDIPYNDLITITGLVIQTYNLDIYQHSIYLRAVITNMDIDQLSAETIAAGSTALPVTQSLDQLQAAQTLTAPSPVLTITPVEPAITVQQLPAPAAPIRLLAAVPASNSLVAAAPIGDITASPIADISDTSAALEVPPT